MCVHICACLLNCFSLVCLFATLWTKTHRDLLSMRFSRQEYWSGLLYPPPGDLPKPEVQSASFTTPELAGKFLITRATWEVPVCVCVCVCVCIYIYIYIQFFYFSWVTTCMYFFSNTNIKMQNPYFCILLFRFNLSKYFGDCSKPYIYITF